MRNGKAVGPLEGYASQIVTDEAIRWLDAERDKSKPFLLYTCFHEPHEPISTAGEHARKFPSTDPSFSAFYGNIAQMDESFGRLMRALDERGLRDDTLVWFTSDNGPAITAMHPHGSAGPLRDKKNSLWEGGIRVPGIVRWPARIKAGVVSDEPVCGVDFLPTACEVAGIPLPGPPLDGASLVSLFDGNVIPRATPLYWQFNYSMGEPKVALRQGNWKLLATLNPDGGRSLDIDERSEREVKAAALEKFLLYDLAKDIGETTDLAASEPARLAELRALMEAKYREVTAETPLWPFWKHVNVEAKLIEWPDYVKKTKAAQK